MNKLLFTIATLFAYSGMFSQTWNTGTGAWISPLSKNIGIQKSLQIGDNVGTDSLWCKTDLNYFEGNVGIGTTAPVAKLHVAINDTTGLEIAHFENNLGAAIMTLHSHADSSAIYLMETGAYSAAIGLEGVTKELRILNGLGSVAIEIDTNNNVTIPDLAGSAEKVVIALADGTLDTISIASLGTGFTIDGNDNMYAGSGALSALTNGTLNFVAGINAGSVITDGGGNVLIGNTADVLNANQTGVVAVGYGAVGGEGAVSVGVNSQAQGNQAIALGQATEANHTYSVALGINATTTANKQFMITDSILHTSFKGELVCRDKSLNTTAGDAATINSVTGRFRKDTSGSTFTLTNSYITANSIVHITYASDPGITGFDYYVVAGTGSAVLTFTTSGVAAAPANNTDVNFWIIN